MRDREVIWHDGEGRTDTGIVTMPSQTKLLRLILEVLLDIREQQERLIDGP